MSYVDVFDQSAIAPSDVSFVSVALAANTNFYWPSQDTVGLPVMARTMEVRATAGPWRMYLPDATQVSNGEDVLLVNRGTSPFFVATVGGTDLLQVIPGQTVYVYLTDNETRDGSWGVVFFGANVSGQDATALAGLGLLNIGGKLNLNLPMRDIIGAGTVLASDRAMILRNTGGAYTYTLPDPSGVGFGNGFFFGFRNQGSGAVDFQNVAQGVDGVTDVSVNPSESCFFFTNGLTWQSIGLGRNIQFAWTMLNKNVAGSGTTTLTNAEAANGIIRFFGALTGDVDVVFPSAVGFWEVHNATSGAHNLNIETLAGTPLNIPTGHVIVYCDGSNMQPAVTSAPPATLAMADGGPGAPGLAFSADTDTGFYRPGANQIAIATGGIATITWDATGAKLLQGAYYQDGYKLQHLMMMMS
jgi:hypothetical protein